ncbi:MAG: hypothetical protein IT373_35170, partial [Polyangiaceae bacterium]|nr:hypothetical protein [Polyangiaceae bacterium]
MATQYMKVLASLVVAAGAAALAVSGCELIASVDRTEISTGGSAPVGGSGGTGGVAGQGGGGGPACDPVQCAGTGTDCAPRACDVNDACTASNAVSGTACDDAPPDGQVCDGAGTCVECVDNAQCAAPNDLCDTNAHVCVPPICQNGTLDAGETDIDCGGPTCGACANTKFCNDATDCLSAYCDTSAGGGQGGSGAAGVCTACANDGQCLAAEWCNT